MRAHGQTRFVEKGEVVASSRGRSVDRVALAVELFHAMIALRLGRDVATKAARQLAAGRGIR